MTTPTAVPAAALASPAATERRGPARGAAGDAVIGIDVGGTKTAVLVAGQADEVLARFVVETGTADLTQSLTRLARQAMATVAGTERRVVAVGVAAPGLVEAASGVVRLAVNVETDALPLGPALEVELGVPCFVEHDTRAAAAWLHATSAAASANFAFVSVGTGISAGVVLDGRLHRGATGLAGEIGHARAVPDGERCACGLRGCLETVASGPAIAAAATARGRSWSSEQVFAAAAAGDPVASDIAADVGRHLGDALRGLVLAYGVDRIVLGGGVSRAGRPYLEPILAHLERERALSPLLRHALGAETVRLLPPDVDAGGWGAVTVARLGLAHGRHQDDPVVGKEGRDP